MKKACTILIGVFCCQSFAGPQDSTSSFNDNSNQFANENSRQLAQTSVQLAQSLQNGGSLGNPADYIKQQASNALAQQGQKWLHNLFSYQRGTTEISGATSQHGIPTWDILLVRPIIESDDMERAAFTQLSVFRQGNRTTGNAGLGYRQLVDDKKVLLGVNSFYDYEFPYNNQRASVGGEVRTSVGEINVNYYIGTSGWVSTKDSMEEKSLSGYDGELALAVPYIPSVQARMKTFRWDGTGGVQSVFGNTYSLTGAVWQGLYIEAGHTVLNSSAQPNVLLGTSQILDGNFVKVSWIFGGDRSPNQKQFTLSDKPYSFNSMEERLYEKVRRENLIVKAQRSQNQNASTNFNVTVSGF
ncbi:MAG: inverse autotransporter beta domain-containing protein [Methylobacter sp.]|jgi:adhesin/invasin|nr:inverse autotransporter beta domain-containing protein [Methylobacter sp.]